MHHVLPTLPYDQKALEPYLSANTLFFHYTKHHQGYVDTLNKLIEGTPFEALSLEEIVQRTAADPKSVRIYNNAAQAWNHAFFWKSMTPHGKDVLPREPLKSLIEKEFLSLSEFKAQFKQAALTQFGSGWVWLVSHKDRLEIYKTSNADTPLAHRHKALLTCDVWEHAYYLDYQNRRADFVEVFLDHLMNWNFAAENFENA